MKPTVICGPSGVGVRTLIKRLQSQLPDTFGMAVSYTTRKARGTETDKIDYYFIDKQEFESRQFLEYMVYDNEYYGTSMASITDVMDQNKICLLKMDVFGAEKLRNNAEFTTECNYLYITTSNGIETLKKRLIDRNTEAMPEIERRLQTAQKELDFLQSNPNFFDCVIYNDKDIDEGYYQFTEQFIAMYPHLKDQILDLNNNNSEMKTDNFVEINNGLDFQNVSRASKRQSMDLFADFANNQKGFVTQESLCREVFKMEISPFKDNMDIIGLIIEFADIPPRNRKEKQFKFSEFAVIINSLSSVEQRWTLGNAIDIYPRLNESSIGDVYFAYHEKIMTGVIFYLCGTVKCPVFAKKFYGAEIENIDTDWDECWDVYFYMKCDSDYRGSVQFSRQWTNMLIFGIDNDAVRQATENGIWKLNTKQSNNFLIKASPAPSSICEDDENEQIVDD